MGLITNRGEQMLAFWRDEIGLRLERTLKPVPGVIQHKLTLGNAVLKVNCLDAPLPVRSRLAGLRMLMLVDTGVESPQHVRDPDGNLVCLLPVGVAGVGRFGVHLAVSNESAFHDFYGRVLHLTAVGDRAYDCGGATISFAWSPDVVRAPGQQGAGFGYITFQVMDAFETHRLICGRGADEERPPSSEHTSTESTISFVLDPDGNRIEISQRPDLVSAAGERSFQY
ncbi:MAG: VOC family protein [Mycobacterium sp.]